MRIRLFAKTLLAVLLCSSAFAASMDADRSWNSEHRYAISLDPIGWTAGNFHAQIEASINDRLSLNMPIDFGFKEVVFKNTFFSNGSYFAPKFGVKYYVTGKATHQGFYVNPLLGMFIGKSTLTGVKDYTGGFSYGFRMGYAWNIWHGLWLDSFVGYEDLATRFNSDDGSSTAVAMPVSGWDAGLMLGYNW